jgi:hypothetical protein
MNELRLCSCSQFRLQNFHSPPRFQRMFALVVLVAMLAVVDKSRAVNCSTLSSDQTACTSSISDQNGLFCVFVSDGVNLCVHNNTGCTSCQMASNGVCSSMCASPCLRPTCPETGCANFLKGWSGTTCERFASGGFCNTTTCITSSSTTIQQSCDTLPTVTVAVCGSQQCRLDNACQRGALFTSSSIESYCLVSGEGGCGAGQRCDHRGQCVARTICDDIDRQSDCGLITFPTNGRPCEIGADSCNTPTGNSVTPLSQAGCSSANMATCESQMCTRNGGRCIWVNFRPNSTSSGTCACPPDCPPCASLVNGVCTYNCTTANMDGCFTGTCPAAYASRPSCYFPSAINEVVLGQVAGSCVCHVAPLAGCGNNQACDVGGKCGTATLCSKGQFARHVFAVELRVGRDSM